MIRDPLTGRWSFLPAEIWQEKDHQAHVQAYYAKVYREIKAISKQYPIPVVWSSPTRPAYRNPTIQEDPAAFTYGFD